MDLCFQLYLSGWLAGHLVWQKLQLWTLPINFSTKFYIHLNNILIRDVNLPLFGGIPLVFFAFLFFRNHFPLFLVSRRQKTKKHTQKKKPVSDADTVRRVQRACHCGESSKSFGTRVLAFYSSESKFESTVSPLGSRNLTPTTMHRLPRGRGRGGWWSSGEME